MKKIIAALLCSVLICVTVFPTAVYANTFETAEPLELGESVSAQILRTEDSTKNYWVSFYCAKADYYTITVNSVQLSDNMVIEVYDAYKNLVETAVNNTGIGQFSYTLFLNAYNTYFIKYYVYDDAVDFKTTINYHYHSYTKFDLASSIADDDSDKRLDGFARFTCPECNSSYIAYTIPAPTIVVLSSVSMVYSGAQLMPAVYVYDYTGRMIPQSEYYVSYQKNINPGKAYATITFLSGSYQGELTKSFLIKPKKQNLSSVKSDKSKQLNVVWEKDVSVTGYELQYSTSSKFYKSKTKTVTITKNSTSSKTIKSLIANKKYYVRLRAYKTVDGVNQYGSYSSVKSVKIKK